jgi:multidrug resistance protein MdtO
MASIAQAPPASRESLGWLWQWLKDELSNYPGRTLLVARMVTAATLVMILCVTYRLPYAAYGTLFALNLSRESLQTSASAARTTATGFLLAGAYAFVGAMLILGDPLPRFIWIVMTLFLAFYGSSASGNRPEWVRFGYMAFITTPLWDQHITAQARVDSLLWAIGILTMASVVAFVLEMGYAALRRGDDLLDPLAERLACVEKVVRSYAEGRPVDATTQSGATRYAMLGTSRLRGLLHGSHKGGPYAQRMGAVVSLIGRLVDLAANLPPFVERVPEADRDRVAGLANRIAALRHDLENGRLPSKERSIDDQAVWTDLPLFGQIAETAMLIPEAFSDYQSSAIFNSLAQRHASGPSPFAPFREFKTEHLQFGLKGCLAASICYILYSALFWPEISTSVTTVYLTALTTIGSSRQKQTLRIGGAILGGFAIGMGAQVFILPNIDSIAGFTIVFVVVAAAAAWIMTSSPRLSYLGVQVALAYFLINLSEFRIQTSLSVARDRVVGILLGTSVMWLVFDRLWSAPAAVEMKRTFVATLRLLAQLAREPGSDELPAAVERIYSLRETINAHFDKVRSLADGVLFEFGSSRRRDLELRTCIREWQPELRALFVMRVASLKYRLQLPGFELPESVRLLHEAYDDHSARMLEGMADRIENNQATREDLAEGSRALLNNATQAIQSADPDQFPTVRTQSFVTLLLGIDRLTASLFSQIAAESGPGPLTPDYR